MKDIWDGASFFLIIVQILKAITGIILFFVPAMPVISWIQGLFTLPSAYIGAVFECVEPALWLFDYPKWIPELTSEDRERLDK